MAGKIRGAQTRRSGERVMDVMDALKNAGDWHDFYGVDGDLFKLGSAVYRAEEYEPDCHRSELESVEVVPETGSAIFFRTPVARVRVTEAKDVIGWLLVDEDGHCWLEIGTDYHRSWYPMYVFHYEPKPARRSSGC